MSATTAADLPGRYLGPPGIYIRGRKASAGVAPTLMTGVPAFVGFTDLETSSRDRHGQPGVVLTRRYADLLQRSVAPATGSFLPMAIRGFFANGGNRCVVITVPRHRGVQGLLDILDTGGPLDDRSDFDLLCVPDAVSKLADGDDQYQVQRAALRHCARMADRFAILDTGRACQAPDPDLLDELQGVVAQLRSTFSALYFPWIAAGRTQDLTAAAPEPRSIEWRKRPHTIPAADHLPEIFGPPCGHIAGLYARTEALIGPQQSPANVVLENAVDVSVSIDDREHASLNDAGVNCLRSRRGGGISVGGARTLSNHRGLDYVSSARVYLGFRRWLEIGMRDLVFEPNDDLLRARVRRRLESHCRALLEAGALAGAAASDAFFVKCDDETNGPEAVELGRVVADVGLALSVPAEYIIIRVEHDPGGTSPASLS
jgi:hypothetical protein